MCGGRSPGLWPPSVGPARSVHSVQSVEEWEDTEEQMGQTLSRTRSLRSTLRGQGNPH